MHCAGEVRVYWRGKDYEPRTVLQAQLPGLAEPRAAAVYDNLLVAPDDEEVAGDFGRRRIALGLLRREVGRRRKGLRVARLRERDGIALGCRIIEFMQRDSRVLRQRTSSDGKLSEGKVGNGLGGGQTYLRAPRAGRQRVARQSGQSAAD